MDADGSTASFLLSEVAPKGGIPTPTPSGDNPAPPQYIWDQALVQELESTAEQVPPSTADKAVLKAIAIKNEQIICSGNGYKDVSGHTHSLALPASAAGLTYSTRQYTGR